MYTVTLAKFKGGVGATEAAFQISALYALAGWRVLVVDADPHGGITKRFLGKKGGIGILTLADAVDAYIADRKNPKVSLSHVIRTVRVRQDMRKNGFSTVAMVPANLSLHDEENSVGNMPVGRMKVLKRMLATVADQYDICMIDTSPDFGYISRNAVVAADGLLLPLLPEPPSFEALQELRDQLVMMAEEEHVPGIVGTIASRFSMKSTRHAVAETLLRIASGECQMEELSLYDGEGEKFDISSIAGLRADYLGSVANDNSKSSQMNLRKSYMPIAAALAKNIGLGVLNTEVTEAHHAAKISN